MSKDPYYKCNTVTPKEQSDLQNQGAKFANDTKTNFSPIIIILDFLIIIGFIAFNIKIKASSSLSSSSLLLFILVIFLFIVLVLWFTGIARSEGFKGKRKNKKGKSNKNKKGKSNKNKKGKSNKNKKKSNKNKKSSEKAHETKAHETKNEPKPVKQKSNLNPTLIAVLPVLAFGFIATIANVLYHR